MNMHALYNQIRYHLQSWIFRLDLAGFIDGEIKFVLLF